MVYVIHNEHDKRYEVELDDQLAFLAYREVDGLLDLYSTQVPPPFRGKGIAGAIVKRALDDADAAEKKIIPTCGYVAVYIKRNPKYNHLIAK